MQDIEREAMDIQLQDKLLEYKQSMGLLGAGSSNAGGNQLGAGNPAENKNSDGQQNQFFLNEGNNTGGNK
jgi:hypothetical protein